MTLSEFDEEMAGADADIVAVMGVDVTYTPDGGQGVTVKMILDEEVVEGRDGGDGHATVKSMTGHCLRDASSEHGGVDSPARGDSVTIAGVAWRVGDFTRDATMAHLDIEWKEDTSRHHAGHLKRVGGR